MSRTGRLASAAALLVTVGLTVVPTAARADVPITGPLQTTADYVLAVDWSGRRVIVSDTADGASGALRIDHLTGEQLPLPPLKAVSADGSTVITVDGHWKDLDTGATATLPDLGQPVRYFLTGDGTHAVASGLTSASTWLVDGATGASTPLAGLHDVEAISASGRWAVFRANCLPTDVIGGVPECDHYRWRLGVGVIDRVARRSAGEVLDSGIVDSGRVVVRTYTSSGDVISVLDPGHGRRVVRTDFPSYGSHGQLSANGRIYAWEHSPTLCCMEVNAVDLTTGQLSEGLTGWGRSNPSVAPGSERLSGDGSHLAFLFLGAIPSPTTPHSLVDVSVPGVAPVPRLRAGETLTVPVAGHGSVSASATAAILDLTVTDPAEPGYLTAWPCGAPRPLASNLNFAPGQTVANAAVVGLGTGGAVCVVSDVAVDVVVDVEGWFGPSPTYHAVTPGRLVDTRRIGVSASVGADQPVTLAVAGKAGVAADARAVVLDVTATDASGPGYVTVWPCDQPRPNASNLNFAAGQTVANAVVATLAMDGSVCLVSNTALDLVVDAQGWIDPTALYTPAVAPRIADTRTRPGATLRGPNVPAATEVVIDVPGSGAAALNVTVTNTASPGYLTVYPCGSPRPNASMANFATDQTVANLAVVTPNAGRVCFWSNAALDLVVDVQGRFASGAVGQPPAPERLIDTRS